MRNVVLGASAGLIALAACGNSSGGASSSKGDASAGADGSSGSSGGPTGDGAAPVGNTTTAASWFPSTMYFNIPVDTAPVDTNSSAVIDAWVANGGWGEGHVQVDFSIDVYYADSTSVRAPFMQNDMLALPDSDIPTTVPIAPGLTAATSPAPGFECGAGGSSSCDDCHYLVVDPANHQLMEVYGATTDGTSFSTTTDCGRSVAIWPFDKAYPGNLRGDVCTSADASGGLMAPTLFTVEEVAAGHIDHAIRFILPNAAIQNKQYVRPVTHGTGGSGWAMTNGVPYGGRFPCLKSDLRCVDVHGGRPGRARGDEEVRDHPPGRRQHRAHREERRLLHAQVGQLPGVARSRGTAADGLRDGGRLVRHGHGVVDAAARLHELRLRAEPLREGLTPPCLPPTGSPPDCRSSTRARQSCRP